MNTPYAALKQYPQFILWEAVYIPNEPKPRKIPCSLSGDRYANAHDPVNWMDFDTALFTAQLFGGNYGVAFVFTANDPFFVVDIDGCLTPEGTWSELALTLIGLLPGCLVEVSHSAKGLHLIGSGVVPSHGKKNTALGIELYSELRFLALGNMETATGSAALDCTPSMPYIVATYFPQSVGSDAPVEWTAEPCEEWHGITDDSLLLEAMLKSRSGASMFGGGITFSDLWFADATALARNFPPQGGGEWDGSSADASLAQMLAFWTGKNCERMERLMRGSALLRDKWEREDYLPRTILRACALQGDVYGNRLTVELDPTIPVCKLRGTPNEVNYAEGIRAQVISQTQDAAVQLTLAQQTSAKLWINNRDVSPEEIARMVTPAPLMEHVSSPTIKTGLQYLAATQQIEHFKGCIYVISQHKVFTPKGDFLDMGRFNAKFGGYLFQMDEAGDKTTKKAWEAFTESQVVAYPQADDTWFRPDMPQGRLVQYEGKTYVNTYTPIETERKQGDVSPFLNHVAKLLPIGRDQTILLSYMAACVQHIGVKFQWCPLIQGAEGNGKSFLTTCVAKSIGERYTHLPPAQEIAEKFNGWMFTNLLIGVEDVYVPEHKKEVLEVLKPMITGKRQGKRVMNQDPTTGETYANFILNSNHKNAIQFTDSARRWCALYCAQQEKDDLTRDGMNGTYMPNLYQWANSGGFAIVNDFLRTYAIPDEFNPATSCHRAPLTSSTQEAVDSSRGSVEHLVIETVEEDGFIGMRRGWISSVALDRLLRLSRKENTIPLNKRKELLRNIGYEQHPGLKGGRVNSNIMIDDGKKPYLYIKIGSELGEIVGHAEIVRAYQEAQDRREG
jgi:primase-polymerase (primpol)-like protein